MATYKELKEYYTFEDAIQLMDIVKTNRCNEYILYKKSIAKNIQV